ncbi:hypothetical protein BDF14DRAFT_1873937 [Spinellus fusiger]|nr:hypothetical protein BDF14DRAFT_1873937 [Spinellus fusiger]
MEVMRKSQSPEVLRVSRRLMVWINSWIRRLDDWILEPLLTVRRFLHILLLFVPVAMSSPLLLFGEDMMEGDTKQALWWYEFLAAQMERAGPTFIKLAQWVASRTDLFPMALCLRLSKLHSQVDPHPFSHTKRVIEAAFHQDMDTIFSYFDTTPLGVGAIAQVYKATLRPTILVGYPSDQASLINNRKASDTVSMLDAQGNTVEVHTTVAIKVIHPKAHAIVHRDLKIMNFFAYTLTWIPTFQWLSLPDEVRVFGMMMKDQLDLRIEGHNLERFNAYFKDSRQVEFPRPLMHFTTQDMLIEEYENGVPLHLFLSNIAYSKKAGLNTFLYMLIFHNFVHADLHPGNIMVKFYPPSIYTPIRKWWSQWTGQELNDDGDAIVSRIMAVRDDPAKLQKEIEVIEQQGYAPRLVFIDAGLVNELNDTNRLNFLDLFQAIAQFDGYRAGELMVERCKTPELVVHPDVFALKMNHLILKLKQNTFNLGAVKIGNLLHETMSMVRNHRVKLEGDFVNVIVSIMLLEGIGRQLNPDLDLFKMALPVLREYTTIEGVMDMKQHPFSPHWLKVWIFLEFRAWFGETPAIE